MYDFISAGVTDSARLPNPIRSGYPGCAPTAIPAPLQSDTVFCITKLSPACQPHATFAEVISGMTFSSFPIL